MCIFHVNYSQILEVYAIIFMVLVDIRLVSLATSHHSFWENMAGTVSICVFVEC